MSLPIAAPALCITLTMASLFVVIGQAAGDDGVSPERDPTSQSGAMSGVSPVALTEAARPVALFSLPEDESGLRQSPINILSSEAQPAAQHSLRLLPPVHGPRDVENTGHSVQLNFPKGGAVTFDDQRYALEQVHFHTPSEHRIDGVSYPMEMHVVSRAPGEAGEPSRYVVVAVLFRMGKPSAFVDDFIERLPKAAGAHAALSEDTVSLWDTVSPESIGHHYHYAGSLTTPPYTETVEWLVQAEVVEASPSQIATINGIEGNNARHIQALHSRVVERE